MKKTLLLFTTLLLLIGTLLFTGCDSVIPTKEYTSDAGITLTLPSDFVEKDVVNYTYTLANLEVTMMALKEEFTLYQNAGISPDTVSLKDYASLVITANKLPEDTEISESDGLTSFTYENDANGKTYFYYATVFKGSDAFWLVQFGCDSKNQDEYKTTFVDYAKTVVVK